MEHQLLHACFQRTAANLKYSCPAARHTQPKKCERMSQHLALAAASRPSTGPFLSSGNLYQFYSNGTTTPCKSSCRNILQYHV
jgi:hypothetical protein